MGAAKIPEKVVERRHESMFLDLSHNLEGYINSPKGDLIVENEKLRNEISRLKNRKILKIAKKLLEENKQFRNQIERQQLLINKLKLKINTLSIEIEKNTILPDSCKKFQVLDKKSNHKNEKKLNTIQKIEYINVNIYDELSII